jgi:LmbE family N-acetylglucosaminyl deacetylase
VTYNENGFYGHPDHINAHRVAVGAYDLAGDASHDSGNGHAPWAPSKLYYTAVARSAMVQFGQRLRELGIDGPGSDAEESPGPEPEWGTPDELITTEVDVSAHVEQKRLALFAHATQMGPEVFFAKIPPPVFQQMFGREQFQLVKSRVPSAPRESDLFDGLR